MKYRRMRCIAERCQRWTGAISPRQAVGKHRRWAISRNAGRSLPLMLDRRFSGNDLIVDPGVGLFHAVAELDLGCPVELLLDEGVVAVAAVYAFGSAEIVGPLEFDTGNVLHDIHKTIDGHDLVA